MPKVGALLPVLAILRCSRSTSFMDVTALVYSEARLTESEA